MSLCAEPATAGMALTRTLRINAKLAAFNWISPCRSSVFVAALRACLLTIENNYLLNTTRQRDYEIHVSTAQNATICWTGEKTEDKGGELAARCYASPSRIKRPQGAIKKPLVSERLSGGGTFGLGARWSGKLTWVAAACPCSWALRYWRRAVRDRSSAG